MSEGRVAVIGAGAWGLALAAQAVRAGRETSLWARTPGRVASTLPEGVRLLEALPGGRRDLVLLAVPCQHIRATLGGWRPDAPLLNCAKGVERGSGRLPLEILGELLPDHPAGVLTGPNFAHEVRAGLPTAAVVAAADAALRERAMAWLATPRFRLYGNDDPLGAQLGGAAKNVIAIAAGAVIGAGLGENARAALLTRALAELSRLVAALGGRAETVTGLSGLGDLLLTCTGEGSRNYSLGLRLGRGEALGAILAGRAEVTEGVATAPALVARAAGVELPICAAVAALLEGRADLPELIGRLLARPLRDE